MSTTEQMTDGYGLESQEQAIRQYIERSYADARITIFRESHTGHEINRPEFNRMMQAVRKKQVDSIIVWKIDRVSRVVKDLVNIIDVFWKHDVNFLSVEERIDFHTPMGRQMYYSLSSMAELERHNIINRTLSGKIMSACTGNFTGPWAPYGYRKIPNPNSNKGNVLKIIPRQAHWVNKIYHLYTFESLCPERIAMWINEQSVPYDPENRNSKNGKWSEDVVYRLLQNPIYQGKHIANKRDVMGKILPKDKWTFSDTPVITDPLLWQQAQEARTGRRKFHGKDIYLLSGKIWDGDVLGNRKFVGIKRTKGGISYRRKQYTDTTGNYIPTFEVPGQPLEEYAWGIVKQALISPECFYTNYLNRLRIEKGALPHEQIQHLKQRLSVIQNQEIPRIQTAYEKGIYDEAQTQQRMTSRQEEVTQLKDKIAENEITNINKHSLHKEYSCLQLLSEHYSKKIDEFTQAQKKEICDLVIEKMILSRTRDGKKWDIKGQVVLRFDLAERNVHTHMGRTHQSITEPLNSPFQQKCRRSGETANLGYISNRGKFVLNFEFKKIWNLDTRIWNSSFTSQVF